MSKQTNLDTIMTFKSANLFVDYYWDNHGREVLWNEYVNHPTVWTKANIEIGLLKVSTKVLDRTFEFESKQLIVDGNRIGGDVTEVIAELDEDNVLEVRCKVTVGWG